MSPAVAAKGSSVPASRPAAPGARDMAYLGPGLTIKGQITGTEDLQIDGTVHGPITLNDKRLTAGHTAQLHSQINAREVVVNGNVTGDLHARERIEIKKTGSVVGNMTTARIVIEEGAYFKGSVEIAKRPEKTEKTEKAVSETGSVSERELAAMPV
jgi:cytoskeletal protein CcmA (bactofilin family)